MASGPGRIACPLNGELHGHVRRAPDVNAGVACNGRNPASMIFGER
jgi:hypothetical protein